MSIAEQSKRVAQAEEFGRQSARAGKGVDACPFRAGSASILRDAWERAHANERSRIKSEGRR